MSSRRTGLDNPGGNPKEKFDIAVEERQCPSCDWTGPEAQDGVDVCPGCGDAYPTDAEWRTRDWPRCSHDPDGGPRCGKFAPFPGSYCPLHWGANAEAGGD